MNFTYHLSAIFKINLCGIILTMYEISFSEEDGDFSLIATLGHVVINLENTDK